MKYRLEGMYCYRLDILVPRNKANRVEGLLHLWQCPGCFSIVIEPDSSISFKYMTLTQQT